MIGTPAAILAHTIKGKGVSFMEDRHEWHGKAPNREQAIAALAELGEVGEDILPAPPGLGSWKPAKSRGVGGKAGSRKLESESRAPSHGDAPVCLEHGPDRPRRILRDAFGETLVDLGAELPNLVVLDADISSSLKTGAFRKQYPERHVNFGVAEQDMMLGAAGMATTGLIPVACTYATFATLRACEQIRSFICYAGLNVKIACSHGGLEVGWDGPTHQGTEDIAIMRSFPNMTVIVPADAVAASSLLRQAVAIEGPVYFRMGRNPVPVIYAAQQSFTVGRAITVREGSDLTIIAAGVMVALALDAAEQLAAEGVQARVVDMHTVKPLDSEAVHRAATETGAIVTAEDHSIIGGLGSAVAEYLVEHTPVPVQRVGVPDTFCRSGDPVALFERYGMAAPDIARAAREVLRRKKRPGFGE
jgi:transketolase